MTGEQPPRPRWSRGAACVSALRDPAVGRIVVAYFCFQLVEAITWTGSLVYAYRAGGAAAVGVVGFVLLVPAVVLAPLAAFCGDRFHRVRVLTVGYATVSATSLATGLLIAADVHRFGVYAVACGLATAVTFPRPAMGALLPCTVGAGDQLTAANVAIGIVQSLALALGPVIAGVLLLGGEVATLFFVSAGLVALSGVLVARVPLRHSALTDEERMSLGDVRAETIAGLRLLQSERSPRVILSVLGVQALMIGFLDVLAVVVALDVLGRAEQFAGWLAAATGIGAVVGAAAAVTLVGRRRLAPGLLTAAVATVVPVLAFVGGVSTSGSIVVFAVCGVGLALTDVSGQTLLQRVTPDELMARVYGVLEGFRMASIAIGSLVCSLLLGALSLRASMIVIAAAVVAMVVLASRSVLAIDRDRVPPDAALLDLLRATHFLAPLPAHALERICHSMRRHEPGPGELILEQGASGSSMYVVGAGEVHITRGGQRINLIRRAEHFGELALLDGAPRSADAVAGDGVVLFELDSAAFVMALTGNPRAAQRVQRVADGRRDA